MDRRTDGQTDNRVSHKLDWSRTVELKMRKDCLQSTFNGTFVFKPLDSSDNFKLTAFSTSIATLIAKNKLMDDTEHVEDFFLRSDFPISFSGRDMSRNV